MRRRFPQFATLVLAGMTLLCQSCAHLMAYGEDRVRDISDVIDVRYGTGFGLGVSVQWTELLGTGLGCSTEWYQRQWYGRKSIEVRDGLFAQALIFGVDGDYVRREAQGANYWECMSSTGNTTWFIFRLTGISREGWGNEEWFTKPGGVAPSAEFARIGGAVFLPGVNGGIYVNLGEVIDFVSGLFGYDPMNDDDYPKFSTV